MFHLERAIEQFEGYMVDACEIRPPVDLDANELDPDTLALIPDDEADPIYSGPCLLKWDQKTRDATEGEQTVVVMPTEVYIPLSAPAPPNDSTLTITVCQYNLDLIGQRYAVKEQEGQTVQIARCLYVHTIEQRAQRL